MQVEGKAEHQVEAKAEAKGHQHHRRHLSYQSSKLPRT